MKIVPMSSGRYTLKRDVDDISFSRVGKGEVAVILNGIVAGFIRVAAVDYEDSDTCRDSGDRYIDFVVNTDSCVESCKNCAYVECDEE